MTEFEFLKNMYRRLSEFERFAYLESLKHPKKTADNINDSAVASITCAIEDYLKLRATT
jgi:hypothetical protein